MISRGSGPQELRLLAVGWPFMQRVRTIDRSSHSSVLILDEWPDEALDKGMNLYMFVARHTCFTIQYAVALYPVEHGLLFGEARADPQARYGYSRQCSTGIVILAYARTTISRRALSLVQ